jgi:nitroreductase
MQDSGAELAQRLRTARNARSFAPQPVPQEALAAILEIARWTGSAGHKQPWQFIVIDDKETLRALAASGDNLAWLAGAPLAIVLVMDGAAPTESFDEGRLAERIFAGANALGLAAGVAMFLPGESRDRAVAILNVPAERKARTVIGIGAPDGDAPAPAAPPARKPLSTLLHHNSFGNRSGGAGS